MKESWVEVGIISAAEISFIFRSAYCCGDAPVEGGQQAVYRNGKIEWNGKLYEELSFLPKSEKGCFELPEVTIGVGFHWERKECQQFSGILKLIVENGRLTAVNRIPVESYLTSVISSEMSATASLELLKAHAVISRSWLLNIIEKKEERRADAAGAASAVVAEDTPLQRIVWYDNKAHVRYDVCADDHCQRYQGITRITNANAERAVAETYGEVLMYGEEVCDARFSKCCGGVVEEFGHCWENKEVPYLKALHDSETPGDLPDLTNEAEAGKWIRSVPIAFCHTRDKHILSQVLNNYDQETNDFYRWKVVYTRRELSEIVYRRSGIDFGQITDLIPVERGRSGRITKLRIVGDNHSMIIGKELEIRRTLSDSHLYSSAFVVDKEEDRFVLTGAGWGHGVGLCQIGAAVMGEQGYKYDEILLHYYVGATINRRYEK